jgi:Tol biopolymer transport system component
MDVAATPAAPLTAVAVSRSFGDNGALGGDLLAVDPTSGQVSIFVGRTDANESLGAPAWWFDGSGLLFERQDRSGVGLSYPGTSTVLYPTRIELVQPDGSARSVVVLNGRGPAPAPDGSGLAFLRTTSEGTALMVRTVPDPSERVLIPAGSFRDLASPRYSPQGDRLAFMAPGTFIGRQVPGLLASTLFGAATVSAHGLPWDVWLIGADGSGLHQLAQLGADDGTVSWSPEGSQLFVYGGTGSFLVDAATGDVIPLGYVAGYGSTAWLPG